MEGFVTYGMQEWSCGVVEGSSFLEAPPFLHCILGGFYNERGWEVAKGVGWGLGGLWGGFGPYLSRVSPFSGTIL